jgi:outer membrane receptor protein involved in Fe transport
MQGPLRFSRNFNSHRLKAAVRTLVGLGAASAPPAAWAAAPVDAPVTLEEISVTAGRLELLGSAATASEGVVDDTELQLTPQYRPGQLLEMVPGLIVTLHSGEGKANQYLMRGYNLDHGTDLETYVDGMPINQPTHAHGQGYTDLNFVIPELADGLSYTKGPYYATVGDFGAVGSVRMEVRDTIDPQLSVADGMYGFRRMLGAASAPIGTGRLLVAAEAQHYDGPFVMPDDARKENLVLRWSTGDAGNGSSVTAMAYHQHWTNTTDIPVRAIDEDIVPNRFGSLDPSDGGHAQRASLSAQWRETLPAGKLTASAFFIDNQLHLFNDFTHFLVDPIHGDQEDQFEYRRVYGGAVDYRLPAPLGGVENEVRAGALLRYDDLDVGRLPSEGQVPLSLAQVETGPQVDPPSFLNSDQVNLFAGAVYVQATTRWTEQIRSVLGLRDDYQHGADTDRLAWLHERVSGAYTGYTNGGSIGQSLLQPKASLVYTPSERLELYAAGGEGFHSADVRGVNQDKSVDLGLPGTPLLAKQWGEEVGLRAIPHRDLALTFAVYNLWQQSETIIDPDVGQDSAGPPSRRYGAELNLTVEIDRHLEFYGSYSANHTRFTSPFDDGTGHIGEYITDAPIATGALALYLKDAGPWSAGLGFRYISHYPLSSGPCRDGAAAHDFPGVATSCASAPTAPGQVDAKGFGQWNLDARYAIDATWSASLGLYNIFDTHAAAAQFWYVDRLRDEISAYPDGRADVHQHPLETRMLRVSIAWRFD